MDMLSYLHLAMNLGFMQDLSKGPGNSLHSSTLLPHLPASFIHSYIQTGLGAFEVVTLASGILKNRGRIVLSSEVYVVAYMTETQKNWQPKLAGTRMKQAKHKI